ncbi:MAG: glycosyltransferase [Bacteroidota bacterium]
MQPKSKIGIIGSSGVPARLGGSETLTHHLVLHLSQEFELFVFGSKRPYRKTERKSHWHGARTIFSPFANRGIQRPLYALSSMLFAIGSTQMVLILGLTGVLLLPILKLLTNRRFLVLIDALHWHKNQSNSFRKMYLRLGERIAVRYADVLIADNLAIQHYLRKTYGVQAAMVSVGGNHVRAISPTDAEKRRDEFPFLAERYVLNICRIEPHNHIDMILRTFAQYPRYQLVLVGDWSGSEYGISLKKHYQAYENMHLLDAIYDADTLNLLRSRAFVYLHSHQAGGTNASLVEAMSQGLPVIAYDNASNRETTQNQARYFNHHLAIISALENMSLSEMRHLGENMNRIALQRYSWAYIALCYKQVFQIGLGETIDRSQLSLAPQYAELEQTIFNKSTGQTIATN